MPNSAGTVYPFGLLALISGERLHEHWFSGFNISELIVNTGIRHSFVRQNF